MRADLKDTLDTFELNKREELNTHTLMCEKHAVLNLSLILFNHLELISLDQIVRFQIPRKRIMSVIGLLKLKICDLVIWDFELHVKKA